MIDTYLEQKSIPEFAELVEQRITERHISNIIWDAYMNVKKEGKIISGWHEKIGRLKRIVQEYS